MLQCNKQKQNKSSYVDTDSENGSDKTKDTLYQVKYTLQNSVQHVTNVPKILTNLCEGTYTSDRILRLISSIIKVLKNFQLLKTTTIFDKLTTQIIQLRRLVRINRVCMILKQYLTFIKKKDRKKRDIFDILFKTVMLCTDINDLLAYFMQLNIIKQNNIQALRKNVANLYFSQCILWLCFHLWDYFMKDKTDEEKRNRINNIYKYVMDTILSHNDFSLRQVTFGVKSMSLLGMLSSVFGLGLIWK